MPLEKKQVFPNLFRYVCDGCPFDWPRTPVKESALPPPPNHACPNENRPEAKVVPKEAVPKEEAPKEAVPKEQESKASRSTKPRPVTVCTRCGAVSYATQYINGQCAQVVAGKRCVGVNGSAVNADDWKQCSTCAGAGEIGMTRCGHCDGTGWLYARNKG